MSMSHNPNDAATESLVARIADEFSQRINHGERPTIEEYTQRHPEIAHSLREALAALQAPKAPVSQQETQDDANAVQAEAQMTADFAPGQDVGKGRGRAKPVSSIQVPGYEVLGELGRGGMGVVYKARQIALSRLVALKMLRSGEHAEHSDLQRFRSEGLAVAQLKHPNIVEIYEVGEHDGLPFFSFEFVEGGSLDSQLAGEPQPPKTAAAQVMVLAQAMHAAHEQGLVHRDLKPANILVGADGRLKITDFGLVKHLESRDREGAELTQTGVIVGTPSYMAPEQASGKSKDISSAVDTYALGAILYDMIAGRPPFKGASVLETIQQVQDQEPVPLRQLQPSCPRDLETICLKCLEKNPAKRYASAADLAEDLQAFLQGKPIKARPVGAPERFFKWVKRHKAIAASAAAVSLALLTLVAVLIASVIWVSGALASEKLANQTVSRQKNELQGLYDTQKKLNSELKNEKENVSKANEDLKDNLYFARIGLAANLAGKNEMHAAAKLLDLCPPDRRRLEWHYLKGLCQTEIMSFGPDEKANLRYFAIGPKGKTIAFTSRYPHPNPKGRIMFMWNVRLHELATGRELRRWTGEGHETPSVAYGPNGKRLVIFGTFKQTQRTDEEGFRIYDLKSGKLLASAKAESPTVYGRLFFSQDGSRLIAAGRDVVRAWDSANGKLLQKRPLIGQAIAVSPDRSHYLSRDTRTGRCEFRDAVSGQLVTTALPVSRNDDVAIHPNNKLIAIIRPNSVLVWDFEKKTAVSNLPINGCKRLTFSSNGELLAAGSTDKTLSLLDWRKNRKVGIRRGHSNAYAQLEFGPSGKYLAVLSHKLKIWPAHTRPDVSRLALPQPAVHRTTRQPVFSSDGRKFALAVTYRQRDTHQVIDVRTGKTVSIDDLPNTRFLFTADGKYIAYLEPSQARPVMRELARPNAKRYLPPAPGTPIRLDISVDGSRLLMASKHPADLFSELRIYDMPAGKLSWTHRFGRYERGQFDPTGQLFARTVRNKNGQYRLADIWSVAARKKIFTVPAQPPVRTFQFNSDGKHLVTFIRDGVGAIVVWDIAAGKLLYGINESRPQLTALSSPILSRKGTCLVANARIKSKQHVVVWDAKTGKKLHAFPGRFQYGLPVFSPDERCLALLPERADPEVRDLHTGAAIKMKPPKYATSISRVSWSSDGKYVIGRGVERDENNRTKGFVGLWWNADTGELKKRIAGIVSVSSDGRLAVAKQKQSGKTDFFVHETKNLRQLHSFAVDGALQRLDMSPDGKLLATTFTGNKAIHIWRNGKLLKKLDGLLEARQGFTSIRFSPNGKKLVALTGSGFDEGRIRIIDLNTVEFQTFKTAPGSQQFAFDKKGIQLAVAGNNSQKKQWELRVWNLNSGKTFVKNAPGRISDLQFSLDGKRIVLATDKSSRDRNLRVYDIAFGTEVTEFSRSQARRPVFSPNGKYLAYIALDEEPFHFVRILDAQTAKMVSELRGHGGRIYALAFDRIGDRIATVGDDKTLKLWNPAVGQELLSLPADVSRPSIHFTIDGQFGVADLRDIRIWDGSPRLAGSN